MRESIPIENEDNFEKSEKSLIELFTDAYNNIEHTPKSSSDVGFKEMMQLPLPVVDLFIRGVIPPHLGEKYLSHKLNDKEMAELTELIEKCIESENLDAEAA